MTKQKYNIILGNLNGGSISQDINLIIQDFIQKCAPIEENLYIFSDAKTGALYCECHIFSPNLIKTSTTDVPLDPDEQAEYRANREIIEDHVAFEKMKLDAKDGRTFSNIIAEFDSSYNPRFPIKIIGGQHRFEAIKESHNFGIDTHHGVKIYFGLNKNQRLDVQLISNTNIATSSDLYDRLQETAFGPYLRNWCQKVGFLNQGEDFSASRQRESPTTVRFIRTFIVNYLLGKKVDLLNFENIDTTPKICQTGKSDADWEKIKVEHKDIWENLGLQVAAKEFVLLDQDQHKTIDEMSGNNSKISIVYAEKARNFSIMAAWAFVAGALNKNQVRLNNHFKLKSSGSSTRDPLNAEAMAKGRHKSDPENYRGLGTRADAKERGRSVELFYLQAESGKGITPAIIDAAIKRHFTKQAKLDQFRAEKRV